MLLSFLLLLSEGTVFINMSRPTSLGRKNGYQFGIYLTKVLCLPSWIIYLQLITTVSNSLGYKVSGCYGKSISLTCLNANDIIVVKNLQVGSKLLNGSVNCHSNVTSELCCKMDRHNDCIFNYESKVSADKHEFRVCQGKARECPMKVIWAQNDGKCSSSKYPPTTNYMVADYRCANPNTIMDMCGPTGYSKITSNTTVHLRNYLYPNYGHTNRNCLCNISTVNHKQFHTLRVKAIDVLFNCSNSVALSNPQNNLKNVKCEKAIYGMAKIYSSGGTKPEIYLRYQTINESNIYLWVEISVVEPGKNVINVVCQNMSDEYRMTSELAETNTPGSTTVKGTNDTISMTTEHISAPPTSPPAQSKPTPTYLGNAGGETKYDPKLIGGVTAGLFLFATLIIILIFVWKRKQNENSDAKALRYSSDSNPYDNYNINPTLEEEVYDTIPDSPDGTGNAAPTIISQAENIPTHTYESLKNNSYAQLPDKKDRPGNSSASGSDTSLPTEPAPLPPTPDLFRRLPSIPKEESVVSKNEPDEAVLKNDFVESARSSTQTILENLSCSDPDLSSRDSLTNDISQGKSVPEAEYRGINIQGPSIILSGESPQKDTATETASLQSSGKEKAFPVPVIYHDTE